MQDLRLISQTLLGEKISQTGLIQSITNELSRINKLGISQAVLITDLTSTNVEPSKKIILFRIIQEAISNATKHAPGSKIEIQINTKDDQLLISISDDGPGFNPNDGKAGGIGLLNMKNRAATIGAKFSITGNPGKGTVIQIELPLHG